MQPCGCGSCLGQSAPAAAKNGQNKKKERALECSVLFFFSDAKYLAALALRLAIAHVRIQHIGSELVVATNALHEPLRTRALQHKWNIVNAQRIRSPSRDK